MQNLVLLLSGNDASYMVAARGLFTTRFAGLHATSERILTWSHAKQICDSKRSKCIATTQLSYIKQWFGNNFDGTKHDNTGFYAERDGIKVVLIPDLMQVYSRPEGRHLLERYLQKLSNPELFVTADTFMYTELGGHNLEEWVRLGNDAFATAIDIETSKDGLTITSCAYTLGFVRGGNIVTRTCQVPVTPKNYKEAFTCIRRMNRTSSPKITQNGGYENSYFCRFNAPMHNWAFDTFHMSHAQFPELDRNLAFLASTHILNFKFWKDESLTNLYQYNAKDTHNTFWTFMGQLLRCREARMSFSYSNYRDEFFLCFPNHLCGQEGILVDDERRMANRALEVNRAETAQRRLAVLTGCPEINPNSSMQMKKLMSGVGRKVYESSDAKSMQQFAEAHPIHERLHDLVTDYREANKAISTYYDAELLGQRLLYEINSGATDSGRLASKASNFWVGTQIQNIPAKDDKKEANYKDCLCADPGWELFEVDKSQSESWCTGYLSRDSALIHTLHTSPDFHCTNASLFFGIPFEELYRAAYYEEDGTYHPEWKNKAIRNVAKRVNHGANYNMGWYILWQTMGTKEVLTAKKLLRLPEKYGIKETCQYLLAVFRETYPRVKGAWYDEVVAEVKNTGRLVGPTGWTRITFKKPWQNKLDLNACVAHPPQSLSVMLVNKSYYKTFKLQMNKYPGLLRLKAQIHDSLFGQYKIGHEYIVKEIEELMSVPVKVHGNLLTIPSDSTYGKKYWGDMK